MVGISAIRSGDYYLFEDDSEDDDTESLDPLESKRRETDHDKAGPLQVKLSGDKRNNYLCHIKAAAIINTFGCPIFQWRLCYTQIIIINMHLLLETRHNILIKCHGNYIVLKEIQFYA